MAKKKTTKKKATKTVAKKKQAKKVTKKAVVQPGFNLAFVKELLTTAAAWKRLRTAF